MTLNDWTLNGVFPEDYDTLVYSFYGRRGVVPNKYSPYPSGTIRADKIEVTTPGTCNMECHAVNTYGYQWEKSPDNINWNEMTGETIQELTEYYAHKAGIGGDHYYRCICKGYLGDYTTDPVKITVSYHLPEITIDADRTVITAPGTIRFTSTSSYTTSYQWQKDGEDIPGATASTLQVAFNYGDSGIYDYTCKATGLGGTITSTPVTVMVSEPEPVITIAADKTSITAPDSVTFTASAIYTEQYQWKKNGVDIPGETSATLTVAFAYGEGGTYEYTCEATGLGGTTTSSPVTITVSEPKPAITIAADRTEITAPDSVTLTATATYAESYQWQKNGADIPGETAETLQAAFIYGEGGTYDYTCKATGLGGTVTSSPVSVTVTEPVPVITITPAETTILQGSTVTLTAAATYAESLTWYKQVDDSWIEVGTGESYTTEASMVPLIDVYHCVATGLGGSTTSNESTVTVLPLTPTVEIAADKTVITEGESVTLTATYTPVTATLSLQQFTGESWTEIGTAATKTVTLSAPGTEKFRYVADNFGVETTSDEVEITVKEPEENKEE